MRSWMSSPESWVTSRSNRTVAALAAFARALRMPSASIWSLVSLNPAVSMKRNRSPSMVHASSTVSLVVPGMSDTMARSSPKRALSRVDFPRLGAPTMATGMPSFKAFPAAKLSASWPTRLRRSASKSSNLCRSANSTSSSAKSSSNSSKPAKPIKASRRALISRANPPRSWSMASLWAPACSAAIKSATASAWVKSSRPCRKARCVNSPGPACRHPASIRACMTSRWM